MRRGLGFFFFFYPARRGRTEQKQRHFSYSIRFTIVFGGENQAFIERQ